MGLSCNKTNYSINPPFASRWRCPACQTVSCGFPCCSRPVTGYSPVSESHTPSWNPSVEPWAGGMACDRKSGGWMEGPPPHLLFLCSFLLLFLITSRKCLQAELRKHALQGPELGSDCPSTDSIHACFHKPAFRLPQHHPKSHRTLWSLSPSVELSLLWIL